MPPPVVQIDEANTSGQTITNNVGSLIAFASVDQPSNTANLAQNNPILVGNNSFEKWMRARVSVAAPNNIGNLTVGWSGSAPTDSGSSSTNVVVKYGVNHAFPGGGPTNSTSTVATNTTVGVSGIGVTGSLVNTVGSVSNYWTQQLQTSPGAAGSDMIFPVPYFSLDLVWS